MSSQEPKDLGCVGYSSKIGKVARCNARPRWSVSEYIDQRTDHRTCGLHLSWLVNRLNEKGHNVLVVARLGAGSDDQ